MVRVFRKISSYDGTSTPLSCIMIGYSRLYTLHCGILVYIMLHSEVREFVERQGPAL